MRNNRADGFEYNSTLKGYRTTVENSVTELDFTPLIGVSDGATYKAYIDMTGLPNNGQELENNTIVLQDFEEGSGNKLTAQVRIRVTAQDLMTTKDYLFFVYKVF